MAACFCTTTMAQTTKKVTRTGKINDLVKRISRWIKAQSQKREYKQSKESEYDEHNI